MPAAITGNLHLRFSRIKISSFSSSSSLSSSSPPSGLLDRTQQNPDAVPSSPCSFSSSAVFENSNSLHDHHAASASPLSETSAAGSATSNQPQPVTKATATAAATVDDDSDGRAATTAAPPFSPEYCTEELSSAIASRRLLPPSSPRRSKAIADPAAIAVGVGVAVPVFSTDPYGDFRRSMEQMADEMGLDERSRRERLPELLLCYLVLNRKNAHKYIVAAFVDLMAAPVEPAAAAEKPDAEAKEERGGR